MTVGLAMIVKDEADRLPRLAESLRGQINHAVIVDTGSTDNTPAVAAEVFDYCPVQIVHTGWAGFGPCRQIAMDLAREHTDWVLVMDADETLGGVIPKITARRLTRYPIDMINVREHHDGLITYKPRLTRSTIPWRYVGRTHEYLTADLPYAQNRSDLFWIESHNDGASRAIKFERDIELLSQDFVDHEDARSAFYLGRSYDDLGNYEQAVAWYRTRILIGGWDEETWYASWRLGVMLLASGSTDAALGRLWSTWQTRPHRAEPLHTLAEHYRVNQQYDLAWLALEAAKRCDPNNDQLFIHQDVYDWRLDYERLIVAWYVGEREAGFDAMDRLAKVRLPDWAQQSVDANTKFYSTKSPLSR